MLKVIFYKRPDGKQEEITVTQIEKEQADFFNQNNILVSMEDDGTANDNFICYANWGARDEDGEPVEAIEFSMGRSCQETMKRLQEITQFMMEKHPRGNNS